MVTVLLVLLVVIALAAPRYGVDTRWNGPAWPGDSPPRARGPAEDVMQTLLWLRHMRA